MRTTTETLEDAIFNSAGVKSIIKAVIEPSRIYFDSITVNNAWSGADVVGILDEPTLQDIGYSSSENKLITFLNNSGTLSYAREGSATINSLSLAITGKPGIYGSRLYRINGDNVYRHVITWISGPSLDAGTLVNTLTETPLVAHGVSDTRCAVLTNADGGLRPVVIDNTTLRECPVRFMFPTAIDYGDARTMLSLATFSGAAELDGKTYFYVSNNQKGWVEGIYWDSSNDRWSDIFIAVPTELLTSLCEFRISNVYAKDNVIYLCGQFERTDNVDESQPLSLLLYSRSGKTFALDRFTLVSCLGYRFQATVANNMLYLGNCNRVCKSSVVYTFNGDGTGHQSLDIPSSDIHAFSDSSLNRARIDLRAGDEVYAQHSYITQGSRISVYVGYLTAAVEAEEYVLYGTYIIDEPNETIVDGGRYFSLTLAHFSQWKMRGLNMPFYTEIEGKSSILISDTEERSGDMSIATQTFRGDTKFSIDFWRHTGYSNQGLSIDPISLTYLGGVSPYTFASSHTGGFRTEEIKSVLDLRENPLVTSATVICRLYGWSRSDDETNPTKNDLVELLVITTDDDGTNETTWISNETKSWDNTWPTPVTGSDPIQIQFPSNLVGKRIKYMGMVAHMTNATVFCPARIDVTEGVAVEYNYDDSNTPWDFLEGEGYEIPSSGRPYIMFCHKPYNAWNFQMAASFECSIEGGVSGYPVSVGIVGLAEDGSNYVLGRYDKVLDRFQLVVCRDGIEYNLTYESATVTIGDEVIMMLEHKDGRFRIYAQDNEVWVQQLEYEWRALDSWMYTSDVVAMKCGIYGFISVPAFRIVGLDVITGDDESDDINMTGLGSLPLWSITNFPDSGTIKIGDDLFSYDGKSDSATYVLGPYQYRQNNVYAPPYGNGYGMEVTHFNWTASTAALVGQMFAISAGHAYVNTETLWQVFVTDSGVNRYLRNRARYYADDIKLGVRDRYSTASKVYVTNGLLNVSAVSSSPSKHVAGELASLHLEGRILCRWIAGASGEEDTTVADLVSRTIELAGCRSIFPGDQVSDQEIGTITLGTHDYPDGYDLYFTSPTVDDIQIDLGIGIADYDPSYLGTRIWISHEGAGEFRAGFYALNLSTQATVLIEAKPYTAGTGTHHYRILYHDNSVSVYADGNWVATFAVEEFVYPKQLAVNLSTAITITDVRYVELCDWREAVYIDLETDAHSALGSIIQERPVEMVFQSDGSVAFWYDKVREEITKPISPKQYRLVRPSALSASMDAIVYGIIDVGTVRSEDLAKEIGFATRIHRMSNLNRGGIRASKIIQQRSYESLEKREIAIRIDPRVELGDIVDASFVTKGMTRNVSARFIVESVDLDYGAATMQISGRGYGI